MARLYMVATPYVRDPASSTVVQFISTFGVWLLSERLTLSPIITVVVYAMTLAQAASGRLGPRLRITSYAVWETAVFVVNVLAFVLMGLQARPIIETVFLLRLMTLEVQSGISQAVSKIPQNWIISTISHIFGTLMISVKIIQRIFMLILRANIEIEGWELRLSNDLQSGRSFISSKEFRS
jgi:NhaP-type Na+/H+ or K+/H+ antiporter